MMTEDEKKIVEQIAKFVERQCSYRKAGKPCPFEHERGRQGCAANLLSDLIREGAWREDA